ncbi:MAG: hypothetical protein ACR2NN_19840 [Bryobacteraceae bacterium]
MQDSIQLITMGFTVAVSFIAVLAGVLLNNSLTDLRTDHNNRFSDLRDTFRAEIKAATAGLTTLIERHHSEMMLKLSDMDGRLSNLENERRVIR